MQTILADTISSNGKQVMLTIAGRFRAIPIMICLPLFILVSVSGCAALSNLSDDGSSAVELARKFNPNSPKEELKALLRQASDRCPELLEEIFSRDDHEFIIKNMEFISWLLMFSGDEATRIVAEYLKDKDHRYCIPLVCFFRGKQTWALLAGLQASMLSDVESSWALEIRLRIGGPSDAIAGLVNFIESTPTDGNNTLTSDLLLIFAAMFLIAKCIEYWVDFDEVNIVPESYRLLSHPLLIVRKSFLRQLLGITGVWRRYSREIRGVIVNDPAMLTEYDNLMGKR